MGSSASKPARAAAGAASRRQYPQQPAPPLTSAPNPPPPKQSPPPQGPKYHSKEQPSNVKSDAIDLDARDPDFAASLRKLGPVTPAPTLSHSSTFTQPQTGPGPGPGTPSPTVFPQSSNPALLVLSARQRITKAAERENEEFGRTSHGGREFLDVLTIRQALAMRDHNRIPEEGVEKALRLKSGVMGRLGKTGVVGDVR